ncbi:unnamed protein product, partial [Schistosoma turkestanicum]
MLYLYNLTVHDSAVYQCLIQNKHGTNIMNAYIHVWNQPPAFIHVISGIQFVIEGHDIVVPCETFGAPEAEITWFINGKQLDTLGVNMKGGDYMIETNGNLHIF